MITEKGICYFLLWPCGPVAPWPRLRGRMNWALRTAGTHSCVSAYSCSRAPNRSQRYWQQLWLPELTTFIFLESKATKKFRIYSPSVFFKSGLKSFFLLGHHMEVNLNSLLLPALFALFLGEVKLAIKEKGAAPCCYNLSLSLPPSPLSFSLSPSLSLFLFPMYDCNTSSFLCACM